MVLILYITNHYSCTESIKFSLISLTIFGFSGRFTVVFGLILPALMQQHKPETVTGYRMISLPSLDILAFVIAHKSKPASFFLRVMTTIFFPVWNNNKGHLRKKIQK